MIALIYLKAVRGEILDFFFFLDVALITDGKSGEGRYTWGKVRKDGGGWKKEAG